MVRWMEGSRSVSPGREALPTCTGANEFVSERRRDEYGREPVSPTVVSKVGTAWGWKDGGEQRGCPGAGG